MFGLMVSEDSAHVAGCVPFGSVEHVVGLSCFPHGSQKTQRRDKETRVLMSPVRAHPMT